MNVEELVTQFVAIAAPVLSQIYTPCRCLPATRICVEVMRAFGVPARPLSVCALAMNPAYFTTWQKTFTVAGATCVADERGIRISPAKDEFPEVTTPAAVLIGNSKQRKQPDGWPGHLVAVVDDKWLVDAAALQLHRPDLGVSVPDIVSFEVDVRFLRALDAIGIGVPGGSHVAYGIRRDKSWKHQTAFTESRVSGYVAEQITLQIMRLTTITTTRR